MNTLKKNLLCAASLAMLGAATQVTGQTQQPVIGYAVDSSGRLVKSGWGECWRNSAWAPALALPECEGGMAQAAPMPEPKAAAPAPAPAPAPVAAAPAPEPAPVVAPPPPPPPRADTFRTVITEKPVRLEGANFATGSSRLLPAAYPKLDEVVQQSKEHPDIHFEVSGYTDNVGSAQTNVRLSQARADAVKAYLVGKGVSASRIGTRGYGEESPVADNGSAEGRAQNRRVEIRYTDKIETRVRVPQ